MSCNNSNSEEFNCKEHSALETTAGETQINAPNKVEAIHVSENVERAKDAANHAASVAKTNFTQDPTAVNQFKIDASRTTEAAVSEGKRDVQQAKVIGAGYVEQAKSLANSALVTAQNYIPTTLGGKAAEPVSTNQEAPNVIDDVKNTVVDLYAKAVSTAQPHTDRLKGTAAAVTDAAQPHAESAKEIAQSTVDIVRSHIEIAKSAAKLYLDNAKQSAQAAVDSALPGIENTKAKVQGSMGIGADAVEGPGLVGQKIMESKGNVPSTGAPLENGPRTVQSTKTTIEDIAANDGKTSTV